MNVELVENQPGVEESNMTIFQRIPKMCVSRKYMSPKAVLNFLSLWIFGSYLLFNYYYIQFKKLPLNFKYVGPEVVWLAHTIY